MRVISNDQLIFRRGSSPRDSLFNLGGRIGRPQKSITIVQPLAFASLPTILMQHNLLRGCRQVISLPSPRPETILEFKGFIKGFTPREVDH
jgi:hypothetical protein